MSISKFVTMILIISINQLVILASQRIGTGDGIRNSCDVSTTLPLIELRTTTIGNFEELPLSSIQKEKALIPIVCPQVSRLKPDCKIVFNYFKTNQIVSIT